MGIEFSFPGFSSYFFIIIFNYFCCCCISLAFLCISLLLFLIYFCCCCISLAFLFISILCSRSSCLSMMVGWKEADFLWWFINTVHLQKYNLDLRRNIDSRFLKIICLSLEEGSWAIILEDNFCKWKAINWNEYPYESRYQISYFCTGSNSIHCTMG